MQSFRQGTVSKRYARQLMIGREFWLDALTEDLEYVANGGSKIRFLSAAYGGGKTHFLSSIGDLAKSRGFAVANVELHSREAPLDRFEVVFPKIMRSLEIASGEEAIDQIFRGWLQSRELYDRNSIEREIRAVSSSLDFQAALRAFIQRADSNRPEDQEIARGIYGWLCGDPLSSQIRQHTRIKNRIGITNVSEMFGSLLNLVRGSGLHGVAVFLDEAEAVTSLAQSRKRDEANQNIRKLLDNADRYQGLMIVFSTTPTFLNDQIRGARSYPALWDRMKTVVACPPGAKPNKRSLIINLEPPGRRELKQAAGRIVRLHSLAYKWLAESAIGDSQTSELIDKYLKSASLPIYRTFLRTLVEILDAAEQQGVKHASEIISKIDFGSSKEEDVVE